MRATLNRVYQVLGDGGFVRFVWKTCTVTLHDSTGTHIAAVDGRTYQAICGKNLQRSSTGSTDTGDYVLEFRL